ncbi:signal peptidase I [Brucella tritici]|uniref:signal peptidase I n=1 Tax=Brucella tritici TaxID=94626 RepID=UPI003D6D9EF2
MFIRTILAAGMTVIPCHASAEIFSHSIPSSSMYPTLIPGDLIGATSYVDSESIARGDVVTHRQKTNGETVIFVRRVMGLPGEKIQVRRGIVYVNDAPLRLEPQDKLPDVTCPKNFMEQEEDCTFYREFSPSDQESHIVVSLQSNAVGDNTKEFDVPADHYFLMGDNRDNSLDSRFGPGFISKSDIVAKVRMIWSTQTPGDRDARLKGFPGLKD